MTQIILIALISVAALFGGNSKSLAQTVKVDAVVPLTRSYCWARTFM